MKKFLRNYFEFVQDYSVYYKGFIINSEKMVEEYRYYLHKLNRSDRRTNSIILHTGDIFFDIASVVFMAITALLKDAEEAITDYTNSDADLCIDSLVYIEGEDSIKSKELTLYTYKGKETIDDIKYYKLEKNSKDKLVRLLPCGKWGGRIRPYLSNGERLLTGSGKLKSKTEKRYSNISSLTGVPFRKIPKLLNNSVVIVAPKSLADDIVENVTIKNKYSGESFSFLDIFTASYYTENAEMPYRGNVEKTDPLLKITSKLSVARDLIYNPESNTPMGLFIIERDGVNLSSSELDELVNRRSLNIVATSFYIDSEQAYRLVKTYEDAKVFACTQDFVFGKLFVEEKSSQDPYSRQIRRRLQIIKYQKVKPVLLGSKFSADDYKSIKKDLRFLRNERAGEDSEEFVIQASALLNLFTTAPFSLQDFEKYLDANTVTSSVLSISSRFNLLQSYSEGWSGIRGEKAASVIKKLQKLYGEYKFISPKKSSLFGKLLTASRAKIAVVLPKAYYESIIRFQWPSLNYSNITFFTANGFDGKEIYDKILVLGNYLGKRFNPFRCRAAMSVEVMLYSFESSIFNSRRFLANRDEQMLNRRIGLESNSDNENILDEITSEELSDINNFDELLVERSEKIGVDTLKAQVKAAGSGSGQMINVVGSGSFTDGDVIWFSKQYKATVFNKQSGKADVIPIDQIQSGDILIFTRRNSLTKDIVDETLEKLIDEKMVNESIRTSYRKVKHWKNILRSYMESNEISYEELGIRLGPTGRPRHPATVRSWIHPFSHIVGPMDVESYKQIAQLTQDEDMNKDPEVYCAATKVIRDERRLILRVISSAIIKQLGEVPRTEDMIFKTVYENIDDLSLQKQIESVTLFDCEEEAPIGIVNRPVSI